MAVSHISRQARVRGWASIVAEAAPPDVTNGLHTIQAPQQRVEHDRHDGTGYISTWHRSGFIYLEEVREVFRSCSDCVEWFHGSNRAPKIGKNIIFKSQINKHSQIKSDVI